MPIGRKNMDNKSDDQLLSMQATIETNKKYSDRKRKNLTQDFTSTMASIMYHIKIYKYSTNSKD